MTHNWQLDTCGQSVCGFCCTIQPAGGDVGPCSNAPQAVMDAYAFGRHVQSTLAAMSGMEFNAYVAGRQFEHLALANKNV